MGVGLQGWEELRNLFCSSQWPVSRPECPQFVVMGKDAGEGQTWGPPTIQISTDLWLSAMSTKAWQEKCHVRKNMDSMRGIRVQMACQQFLNSARIFNRVGCPAGLEPRLSFWLRTRIP